MSKRTIRKEKAAGAKPWSSSDGVARRDRSARDLSVECNNRHDWVVMGKIDGLQQSLINRWRSQRSRYIICCWGPPRSSSARVSIRAFCRGRGAALHSPETCFKGLARTASGRLSWPMIIPAPRPRRWQEKVIFDVSTHSAHVGGGSRGVVYLDLHSPRPSQCENHPFNVSTAALEQHVDAFHQGKLRLPTASVVG